MTRLEFERIANRFLSMTREEIQTKLKDPTTTALELMIGSIIVKSVQGGDQRRLDFVLDRTIGKVLTPIGLAGHDGGPLDPYLNMSSEERARLRAEYEKRLGPVKLEKPVK